MSLKRLYSIGHSTRSVDEFIDILKHYGIAQLVDVRTIPRSRTNPQFNRESLEHIIPDAGINYIHAKDLGGLRKPVNNSVNDAWSNKSFMGYADYMQTPEFIQALDHLMEIASQKTTAIMCAEILPWRCHRSLLSDALTIRGVEVIEIFDIKKSQIHKLTSFAVVDGDKITYPAGNQAA